MTFQTTFIQQKQWRSTALEVLYMAESEINNSGPKYKKKSTSMAVRKINFIVRKTNDKAAKSPVRLPCFLPQDTSAVKINTDPVFPRRKAGHTSVISILLYPSVENLT